MFRTLLKSKIQRVSTSCESHGESSCAIDPNLLDAAGIAENEEVHVWNIVNGERFVTHATRGKRGCGMVSVNGSAGRRVAAGDVVIIAAFAGPNATSGSRPKLVLAHDANRQRVPADSAEGSQP